MLMYLQLEEKIQINATYTVRYVWMEDFMMML